MSLLLVELLNRYGAVHVTLADVEEDQSQDKTQLVTLFPSYHTERLTRATNQKRFGTKLVSAAHKPEQDISWCSIKTEIHVGRNHPSVPL